MLKNTTTFIYIFSLFIFFQVSDSNNSWSRKYNWFLKITATDLKKKRYDHVQSFLYFLNEFKFFFNFLSYLFQSSDFFKCRFIEKCRCHLQLRKIFIYSLRHYDSLVFMLVNKNKKKLAEDVDICFNWTMNCIKHISKEQENMLICIKCYLWRYTMFTSRRLILVRQRRTATTKIWDTLYAIYCASFCLNFIKY